MTMAPDSPGAMTAMPMRGDTRPVPDPTTLTTQQLYREIAALREIITTRLDGMDRAIVVLQATTNHSPTPGEIDLDLTSFKALVNEKLETVKVRFDAVAREFALRQDSEKQSALDRKEELKTALNAAEKAVDKQATSFGEATQKSENATGEQIRQQSTLLNTTKQGLEGQLNDLKVRLAITESTAAAAKEAAATAAATAATVVAGQRSDRTEQRGQSNWVFGAVLGGIGTLISLAGLIVVLVKLG